MDKNIFLAYILWFFFGYFAAHRFYVGKFKSAITFVVIMVLSILLMFTGIGLILSIPIWIILGFWWLIDGVLMLKWDLALGTKITTTTDN